RGLGILPPERMVLIGPRAGNPEGVHGLEVRVEPGTVHVVTDEILREFLVLAVFHHTAVPGGEPVKAPRRTRWIVPVVRPLVDVGALPARGTVDAGGVYGYRELAGEGW